MVEETLKSSFYQLWVDTLHSVGCSGLFGSSHSTAQFLFALCVFDAHIFFSLTDVGICWPFKEEFDLFGVDFDAFRKVCVQTLAKCCQCCVVLRAVMFMCILLSVRQEVTSCPYRDLLWRARL
jgi:hypothetical protein